jgi:hypothetical protein
MLGPGLCPQHFVPAREENLRGARCRRDRGHESRSRRAPRPAVPSRAAQTRDRAQRPLIEHGEGEAARPAGVAADRLRDREPKPRPHAQGEHVLLRQVVDDRSRIVGDDDLIEHLVREVLPDADDRHRVVTDDGQRRISERALSDLGDLRSEDLRRRRVTSGGPPVSRALRRRERSLRCAAMPLCGPARDAVVATRAVSLLVFPSICFVLWVSPVSATRPPPRPRPVFRCPSGLWRKGGPPLGAGPPLPRPAR